MPCYKIVVRLKTKSLHALSVGSISSHAFTGSTAYISSREPGTKTTSSDFVTNLRMLGNPNGDSNHEDNSMKTYMGDTLMCRCTKSS